MNTRASVNGQRLYQQVVDKMLPMLDAINQFSVNNRMPSGPLDYYTREAHIQLGCNVN